MKSSRWFEVVAQGIKFIRERVQEFKQYKMISINAGDNLLSRQDFLIYKVATTNCTFPDIIFPSGWITEHSIHSQITDKGHGNN